MNVIKSTHNVSHYKRTCILFTRCLYSISIFLFSIERNPDVAMLTPQMKQSRSGRLSIHSGSTPQSQVKLIAIKPDDVAINMDEKQPLIAKQDCIITIDVSSKKNVISLINMF